MSTDLEPEGVRRTIGYGKVDTPGDNGGKYAVNDEYIKDLVKRKVIAWWPEFQPIVVFGVGTSTPASASASVAVAPVGLGSLNIGRSFLGGTARFEYGVRGPGHDNNNAIICESRRRGVKGTRTPKVSCFFQVVVRDKEASRKGRRGELVT